jgi:DNA mismatch repair protein MutL
VGQVQSLYIVAEGPDGLYLIDQHAAHERVLFEKLREAARARAPQVQGLLAPETLELTPQQAGTVHDFQELLKQYGWGLEPFGERALLIRSMPAALGPKPPAQALRDLLDALLQEAGPGDLEERLATSLSCHAAVRAGVTLSPAEMEELLRSLEQAQAPYTCPHGRPTVVHLSSGHLEREFHRR